MLLPHPLSVKEIATLCDAEVIGNDSLLITGLNEIHNVRAGDITFVDHQKYYDSTLKSSAACILINVKTQVPEGKALLYTATPFEAYNMLAKKFHPPFQPTEAVAKSAKIGAGTQVFPGAFIGEEVEIGSDCVIHPGAVIYPYTRIGNRVIVHANATIGADAFYYKREAPHYHKMHTAGNVLLEDDVEIGANTTIDAGVSSTTTIGKGTKIDNQVHIGHDVKIGQHCIIAGQVGIAGNTRIGNGVTLYGKVAVNKNIEIGDGAIVLASASVAKSLAGGKTYLGEPADEARIVAKQFAMIKRLPELWEKLKKL
jgi:UDP-3-O-[3-hydroxymyristoyl] glucosamine N-acyltransferase